LKENVWYRKLDFERMALMKEYLSRHRRFCYSQCAIYVQSEKGEKRGASLFVNQGEFVPACPKCGALVSSDASFCNVCGSPLQLQQPQFSSPPTAPTWTPSRQQSRGFGRSYTVFGIISAVIGLFLMPEIFCSIAIILGAYEWKRELGPSNRGLVIVVVGIICMLIGIYFTASPYLGDFLSS
jgi:hypothetical protein